MGYGIYRADSQWPPTPPQDGDAIGWHYRASADECEGGEVFIEDDTLLEGMSEPRWDGANGMPRMRTEEEMVKTERDVTLFRIAGQAEASLAEQFVNPNDVLGLVASVLYKTREGTELAPEEDMALAGLNQMYEHALEIKSEIASADPKDLGSIDW